MKKEFCFFTVLFFFVLGCGNKQVNRANISESDSTVMSRSYDSIISDKERAEDDSIYRKSENHRYAQEKWHRCIAEKTKGMTHVDQLLYEYALAIHAVNRAGHYAILHPEKMREKKVQDLLRLRGEEAVRIHDQLLTMKFSDEQRRTFDRLNHLTH